MTPRVSVIMPVFNNALYLKEAIGSILNQTYSDFEYIIINDGSDDGSETIIGEYAKEDNRIVFINDPVNKGLIYRLNQGLKYARGEFIARADGDDICVHERFEKQVKYLDNNPEVTVCSAWYEFAGGRTGRVVMPVEHEDIKVCLLDYCPIAHPLLMCRKSLFRESNLEYDPSAISIEDYDLWTRIAGIAIFANLPEIMLKYRIHSNQNSTKNEKMRLKNLDKCKIRMLRYIWDIDNVEDERLAGLIVRPSDISDFQDVEIIYQKLDDLIKNNSIVKFYNENKFRSFVRDKKKSIALQFYRKNESPNMKFLQEFFMTSKKIQGVLTAREKIKIILNHISINRTVGNLR